MKLSQYAKKVGVTYKTAYRWYRAGSLDAYQTATSMIIVRDQADEKPVTGRIALYARVSSIGQKDD
jgi:putative resolvase